MTGLTGRRIRVRSIALLATAGLAAVVALAGCGSSSEPESAAEPTSSSAESPAESTADSTAESAAESAAGTESSSEASSGTASAAAEDTVTAAAAYPITLTTQYGEVTIPAQPERVVALTVPAADALITLGIRPAVVAVDPTTIAAYYPWMAGQLDDIADASLVSAAGEVNLEAVAQTKPDLIVGATYLFADAAAFKQINDIAPTVIADSTAINVNWDQRLTATAAAFGLTDEANGIIDGIRADFAEVGSQVPGIDAKTYQWVRADPDGFGFGNGSVLELFGLQPAANQDNTQNGPALSKENTAQLDADLLGVWAPTDDLRSGLDSDPLYQALPSVQNGTVFYADMPMAMAANTPAPMALAWLKDEIAATILALG